MATSAAPRRGPRRHRLASRRRGASPTPDRRDLFTAGYWVDLVTEAERGLLDLVTIEDTLGLPSDARTDQVRGRLDAVLVAARVAPLTRHIGIVPTAGRHAHRAVPRVQGDRHARLREHRTGRACGCGSRRRADEAALFGRRTIPPIRVDEPTTRRARGAVRRGRRLRRGAAPAVGQLGGRRGDPRRRDRPVRRPGQAALHRLRRARSSRCADRRSPRGRRRASRWSPRSPTATSPTGWSAARPTSASSRRATPPTQPRSSARSGRSRQPRPGAAEPVHVLGDVVVFLDATAAAAAERKARLDERLGRPEYRSDARVFVGTPAELADLAARVARGRA